MNVYDIEVTELVSRTVLYTVEAPDRDTAYEMARRGVTMSEMVLRDNGVVNRTVDGE